MPHSNEYETFKRKLTAIPVEQETTDSIKLEKKTMVLRSKGLLTYPFEMGYFTSIREADRGNRLDIYINEKHPNLKHIINFISRNKKHIMFNDFDGLITHILNEDNVSINEGLFEFIYLILKDVDFENMKNIFCQEQ